MNLKFLIIPFCSLILFSCDCVINVNGRILDKDSGKPISGATVNLLNGKDIKKTNDKGEFDVIEITGFCKDPIVNIIMTGYKPFQIEIVKKTGASKYIVKTETIWIEYDQPFYPDTANKKTFMTGTWIENWSQDFKFSDSLIVYLSKDDKKREIEKIQNDLKEKK